MKTRLSRRSLIGGLTAVGAATLVGCQVDTGEGPGAGAPGAASEIQIPDYATELPTGDVTFRWLTAGT